MSVMKTIIYGNFDKELVDHIRKFDGTNSVLKIQTLGSGLVSVKSIEDKEDDRPRFYETFKPDDKMGMNHYLNKFENLNLEPKYQTLGKHLLVIKMIPLPKPKK